MINENFVILAFLIIVLADLGYLVDTLKGKVQPNRVSWLMWGVAPAIAFSAQLSQDIGIISLMTLAVGLVPFFIFGATFIGKNAVWKLTRFDLTCGALSLLAILLWIVTRNTDIAIFFSIFADLFAFAPTIKKSFTNPETEQARVYILDSVAGFITLLTIHNWNFANWGFPLYVFIVCLIASILIKFKIGKQFRFSK